MRSGLDQLLRTIFPVEQIHLGADVNFQGTGTSSTGITGTTEAAANAEEIEPRVGDEGTFLSNLLHHIIPIISQDAATGSSDAAPDRADVGNSYTNGPDSTTHVSMHASSQLNLALQEKNQFLKCSCVEPYNIDYF